MGFNSLLLRVSGRVRYMVTADLVTAVVSLTATVLLIIRFGAVGAAIGTTVSFLMQNLLYQWGLRTRTTVAAFDARYMRAYVSIVLGATTVVAVGLVRPSLVVGIVVTAVVSLLVLGLNRHSLQIVETYPELGRFRLMRRIFGDPSTT
jgi:O-antigen/teichoic acid export membrane protein